MRPHGEDPQDPRHGQEEEEDTLVLHRAVAGNSRQTASHRRGHDGSYHGADVDGDWTHSKVSQCDDLHAVDNISGAGGRRSEGHESQ